MASEAAFAINHERKQMMGPAETPDRPELGQGAAEVPSSVGDHAQGLTRGRNPAGPTHRGLGMGEGGVQLIRSEVGGDHDEVLGDSVGILFAQRAELVVHGPVELFPGHLVGDPWLGKPRTLRDQP